MMPHNIISSREVHVANGPRKMSVNVVVRQLRHGCNGVKCQGRAKNLSVQNWHPKIRPTLNEFRGRRPQEQLREIPANPSAIGSQKFCNMFERVSIRFIARARWMHKRDVESGLG